MNTNPNKIIIITGATASGKTALSLRLAKKNHGEIISADSRQIYRGMDIGTAKLTKREQQLIPHHLIDIKKPNQSYSLAWWKHHTLKAIKQIQKRGHIPFIVGGTAYYLNAIVNNLNIPKVRLNNTLRRKLEKFSVEKLFAMLKKKDPTRAETIDHHNKRRLIRALEIVAELGRVPISPPREGQTKGRLTSPNPSSRGGELKFLILGLKKSEKELRLAIGKRTDEMFHAGLVKEVKKLVQKYGHHKLFSETITYAEVIEYLDGKISLRQAKDKINTNNWRYTRRQMTWFKKLPIVWIKTQRQVETRIAKFLS